MSDNYTPEARELDEGQLDGVAAGVGSGAATTKPKPVTTVSVQPTSVTSANSNDTLSSTNKNP